MTIKRLVFMVAVLLIICSKLFAETFTVDGISYYIKNDNVSVSVVANQYTGDLVIPELVSYNNKKYIVNGVATEAFKNCKSVTLPSTISHLYFYDSFSSDSLERIYMLSPIDWSECNFERIPKTCVLFVDGKPFAGDVIINSNIGGKCFKGYNHITSVTIENGCADIDIEAFADCTNLKSVSINAYCRMTDSSFPALDYLHIGKNGVNPVQYTYSRVRTPYRVNFLYCEGEGANYHVGESTYLSTFICDTVISKGYFQGNAYYQSSSSKSPFDYLKVGVYTPEEKNIYYCSNANTKMIFLCDTLNLKGFSKTCLTNYYFWNKNSLQTSSLSSYYKPIIADSLKSAKNVIDFTSFPTTQKFIYSGKSPLETITYVNNTDVIDVKMDSTKCGVNVGEYSGIPFVASLKEWSCDLTWPYDYTIEKAPLTIMGNSITREYGESNPELSCTYIGLVNGETHDVLTSPVRIITTATEESPVGTYPIIPSNATSSNYDITFERGILNIVPASQSITWEQELAEAKVGDIIELSATSSSGLKVSFTSSNTAIVDIYSSNGKWYAECMATGSARITAVQSGNNNYNTADNIVKRLTVTNTDTSISGVDAESNSHKQIYDLEGKKHDTLKHGVNILNGKKVLVK